MTFLACCHLCPEEANAYIRRLAAHSDRRRIFRQLLDFVGAAPQAAPAALADLFLQLLPDEDRIDDDSVQARDLFQQWDLDYFPASPARRPFFDLLVAQPTEGLRLVRGVIAHAITLRTKGRAPGADQLTIPFPTGTRTFPWVHSYGWCRDQDSHVVASALMALEAWGHQRLENGDAVQAVLDDILGPAGSPAAIVLVALDVLMSHWPASREALWPFAACAELLALDRERYAHDIQSAGAEASWIRREPLGKVQLDSLRRRPSRQRTLTALLRDYGLHGPEQVRAVMQSHLNQQLEQLGAPVETTEGFSDPRFAAANALNLLDPSNYVESREPDGRTVMRYLSPPDEARLLNRLADAANRQHAGISLLWQLAQAIEEGPANHALLDQGLAWARTESRFVPKGLQADDAQRGRYLVAALLLRDGSAKQHEANAEWAMQVLEEVPGHRTPLLGSVPRLRYNVHAIAAVGFMAQARAHSCQKSLKEVLELATRPEAAMVDVIRLAHTAANPLDGRWLRAMVRLGFVGSVYAVRLPEQLDWDEDADVRQARRDEEDARRTRIVGDLRRSAVEAELCWLQSTQAEEPAWPVVPEPPPLRLRHRTVVGAHVLDETDAEPPQPPRVLALDHKRAAGWLSLATWLWESEDRSRLASLVRHYGSWTLTANGAGAASNQEPASRPYEWNLAYFRAAVSAAVPAETDELETLVLAPVRVLPDETFLDAMATALHQLDRLWLDRGDVGIDRVVEVREALLSHLVQTPAWARHVADRSTTCERHMAAAIAAANMSMHQLVDSPACYVGKDNAIQAAALVPMLTDLAEKAARSFYSATAFMTFMEAVASPVHVSHLARVVAAWSSEHGVDRQFWFEFGFGARICSWVENAMLKGSPSRAELESSTLVAMMDTLVRCGNAYARTVEQKLVARAKELD